ncbi:MAG: Phenylacetic acid catabolic protein [Phycisphaerae bacterium]
MEPGDWMPWDYRQQLIRADAGMHANSEICAPPEGGWIPHADLRRKLLPLAKVQDEVGHACRRRAAETLGKSREEMVEELISGQAKYSNVFHYHAQTWADVAVIAWLIDAAAIVNQTMMAEGSYGPYSARPEADLATKRPSPHARPAHAFRWRPGRRCSATCFRTR